MAPAVAAAPKGRLLPVRGTHLYVEDWGAKSAPAILYIHGGPGAGSLDFSIYEAPLLSKKLRVVVMDQRGVLRSDRVKTVTMNDLVEDCEGVRDSLGIRRWAIVGHSFGGQVALRYASRHPQSITAIAFENPSLDAVSSMKSLFAAAARVFEAHGRAADAADARKLAASDAPARIMWGEFSTIGGKLGDLREEIYVHQPALRGFFGRMMERSGLSHDQMSRSSVQAASLEKDGKMFEDVTPLLRQLRMPALMIRGDYDSVTAPYQMQAFAGVRTGRVAHFHDSAHFVHVEEPQAYAASLSAFVMSA